MFLTYVTPIKLNFKILERAIKLHVKILQYIRYRREKNKKNCLCPTPITMKSKYTNIWPGMKGNMQKRSLLLCSVLGLNNIFHPPNNKKINFLNILIWSILIFSSHFLLTVSIIHLGTQIWSNKVVWQPRGQVQFAISPCVLRQWNVGHQVIKPGTEQNLKNKVAFLIIIRFIPSTQEEQTKIPGLWRWRQLNINNIQNQNIEVIILHHKKCIKMIWNNSDKRSEQWIFWTLGFIYSLVLRILFKVQAQIMKIKSTNLAFSLSNIRLTISHGTLAVQIPLLPQIQHLHTSAATSLAEHCRENLELSLARSKPQ